MICSDALAENLSLREVLGINGILFPEFTSCCWLYENASRPYFAFLTGCRYLSLENENGISLGILEWALIQCCICWPHFTVIFTFMKDQQLASVWKTTDTLLIRRIAFREFDVVSLYFQFFKDWWKNNNHNF